MHWLLTSTTYATWLPGDRRGFVSAVRDAAGRRVVHNMPDTPYDANLPALVHAAKNLQRAPAVVLSADHASALLAQFLETASFRKWQLLSVAIMSNHFHVVLEIDDRVRADAALRDLKSYGSRALNQRFGQPPSGTWWTASGSKRHLPNAAAVVAAVRYVQRQEFPLVVWKNPAFNVE